MSRNRIIMNDEGADKGEKQSLPSERSGVLSAALVRQETVVLLVDLVESVRLMREHEGPSVRRWADFVRVEYCGAVTRATGCQIGKRIAVPNARPTSRP